MQYLARVSNDDSRPIVKELLVDISEVTVGNSWHEIATQENKDIMH